MKKRTNPYNVNDVMAKHSISMEDALLKIENLKARTSGSLNSFINRYGDEIGRAKFEEFSKKSAHTKQSFKNKYGDDWEDNWNKYRKSKSSGLDALIKKYGTIEGSARFNDSNNKRKDSLCSENLIEKMGIDAYNEMIESKKSGSLKHFISKYGECEGLVRYNESCLKKRLASTLEGFISKHGEELGPLLYAEKNVKVSPIYNQLVKKYGTDDANKIYKMYKNKSDILKEHAISVPNLEKARKSKFFARSRGCVSKESKLLFEALEESTGRSLIYGSKKLEVKIFDHEFMRTYHYDCLDPTTNTLIEFHGIAYHPKCGDVNWVSPFGRKYEEAYAYDQRKKTCAILSGYRYICVYSDEIKLKHDFNKTVKKITKILKYES